MATYTKLGIFSKKQPQAISYKLSFFNAKLHKTRHNRAFLPIFAEIMIL